MVETSWQRFSLCRNWSILLNSLLWWEFSCAFHLAHSWRQIQLSFDFWKIAYWWLGTWICVLSILRIKINFHILFFFYNMGFLLSFLKYLTSQVEFFFKYHSFSWTDFKDFDDEFVNFFIKLDKVAIKFCNVIFHFFWLCAIFRLFFGLHFNQNVSYWSFLQKLYFSKWDSIHVFDKLILNNLLLNFFKISNWNHPFVEKNCYHVQNDE